AVAIPVNPAGRLKRHANPSGWLTTGAYEVFDDVRPGLRKFIQADSKPRVLCHDKQWRLRVMVTPTEQLRSISRLRRNQTRNGTVAATERNRSDSSAESLNGRLSNRQLPTANR